MIGDPLVKLAGLWERTSASGAKYLVGRIGGARVLILANRNRQGDGDPTHHLCIAEAQEKPRPASAMAGPSQALPPRRRRSPYPTTHASSGTGADRPLNDRLEDLWPTKDRP